MALSQTAAAELLQINQLKTSVLVNYRLSGFSAERLILFLNALVGCGDRDSVAAVQAQRQNYGHGVVNRRLGLRTINQVG